MCIAHAQGKYIHDGNFCVDGLVAPDRTPHTGLLEFGNVYRPVRVVSYHQQTGKLVLKNYLDFTNTQDQIEIRYEVSCDGRITGQGKLPAISIKPHETGCTSLRVDVPKMGKAYLKITYYAVKEMPLVADTIQPILYIDAHWEIDCVGGVRVRMNVRKDSEFPELPRFGLRLFLDRSLENVSYYGMGPRESYRDKCKASSHGLYHAKVRELYEDNIRPQESGSHYDCDYVLLTDSNFGLAAAAFKTFSFNASLYTQEELGKKAHNYELEEFVYEIKLVPFVGNDSVNSFKAECGKGK